MKSTAIFYFLLIILLNILPVKVAAQDSISGTKKGAYVLGANLYGGYVMTSYERVTNLAAHTWAAELVFSEKTCGKEAWHCVYGMPRVGFSIFYLDLGKPDITGKVIAVLPHFQKSLISSRKTEISFRLATGLGYFTKVFDTKTNFKNKAISSRLNAAIQPSFLITHKLSGNIEANAGIGITHFSNGSYSLPNNGINVPNIFIGLNYLILQEPHKGPLYLEPAPPQKRTYFYTYAAAGTKQAGNFGERRFVPFNVSTCLGRQVSNKSKIGAGLEAYYDRSLMNFQYNPDIKSFPLDSVLRAGIKIEHELVIGKLGFVTNAGMYFFDNYKKDGAFYQHIGLKYNFLKNAFGGIFLKTHFANADYIEWVLGFNI